MRSVRLPAGDRVPALGLGTWRMGEERSERRREVAALRRGIDLGMSLIDTAEMYAAGGSEKVVAEAIRGRRDAVYLVSKVLPSNAGRKGTVRACEASLKRLGTDRLDLYLLHWRAGEDLAGTLEAFQALREAGKIRHFGVSNFDVDDMEELRALPGGAGCQTNQILYNLSRRWPEVGLHQWCGARNVPLMIYSPLEQGRLSETGPLAAVARRHDATPMQIALAWTLRHPDMFVVPKTSQTARIDENHATLEITLSPDDLATLDEAFPAPRGEAALEVL